MKAEKTTEKGNRFLSVKELSEAFAVHPDTMRKELSAVPGLKLKPYQRLLSPKALVRVFDHLGNPFTV